MSEPRGNQNPDVNSFEVDDDYGRDEDDGRDPNNVEDLPGSDTGREPVPVPPDVEAPYPVEDPPLVDDVPMGDVDDSPTRIAGD